MTKTAPQFSASRIWLMALPPLAFAVFLFPFIYKNVLSEVDLSQMAFALTYGRATGLHELAGYHYGYSFSFGYYSIFYGLLTESLSQDSASLIESMNMLGYFSAVGSTVLLSIYFSRLYGTTISIVTVSIFAFSPMFLELSTSGHPELPALFLFLVAANLLLCVDNSKISDYLRTSVIIIATLILVAALTIRSDLVLAFPFVALARKTDVGGLGEAIRSRLLTTSAVIAAFCLFLVVQKMVAGSSSGESGTDALISYLTFSNSLKSVTKGVLVLVLGTGIVSVVMALLLTIGGRKQITWAQTIAIIALMLPSLALWLPNPTPARHFIFVSLAVALIIGFVAARNIRLAGSFAIGAAVALGNQVAAELSYDFITSRYEWSYPSLTSRRSTIAVPIGSFVKNHRANETRLSYLRHEGAALAQSCASTGHLLVIADDPYYYMLSLSEHDRTLHMQQEEKFGALVYHAVGILCTTAIVVKYKAWPKDVLPDLLSDPEYANWRIYFQEITRGKWDRTTIPAERLLSLPGT